MSKAKAQQQFKITLMKSLAGRPVSHQATVKCLGLSRRHQAITVTVTPQIQGMLNKVAYMLKIEDC